MVESTPGQKQTGTGGSIVGGGVLLMLFGFVFEDLVGTTFTVLGIVLIALGAVQLGIAARTIWDERPKPTD